MIIKLKNEKPWPMVAVEPVKKIYIAEEYDLLGCDAPCFGETYCIVSNFRVED
jgi:hypothetical protein